MRLALAAVVLAGAACGKELNPQFCDAHPADERCMGSIERDAPPDLPAGCPASYTTTLVGSTSKYRVVDTPESWTDAESDCEDDGAKTHLIVLNGVAEWQALEPFNDLERHIGYSDAITEGEWIPVTDDPDPYRDLQTLAAPPWLVGEPNESISGNCVVASVSNDLRDRSCTLAPSAYLCECDDYPANPANF